MNKNSIFSVLLIIFAVSLTFTSCKKETADQPAESTMDKLMVDPSFNWSTTTEYTLNLTGYANSVVKIASTDNIVYHQTMMVRNTAVPVKVTLPSYFTKVNLIYMGNTYEVELSGTSINFSF